MINLSISLLAQLTSELERIHQKRTCAVRREYTEDTDSTRVYIQSIHRVYTAPEYTYMAHALPMKPLERHLHLELGEKYEIPEVSFFDQNAFCAKT